MAMAIGCASARKDSDGGSASAADRQENEKGTRENGGIELGVGLHERRELQPACHEKLNESVICAFPRAAHVEPLRRNMCERGASSSQATALEGATIVAVGEHGLRT